MCGFAGFLECSVQRSRSESETLVQRMSAAMTHRGPDDAGIWLGENGRVAFGHRRLAILDTSTAGRQPMTSRCGRFVLAYNGEVYNFRQLRKELGTDTLRSDSDTEVLLEAISVWGLARTLPRLVGMFAFVLWDAVDRTITLVRDRCGIKPVYYGQCGHTFLFGSELKAFKQHPDFDATVCRGSLARFLQHNYVPSTHTIYRDCRQLSPGAMLTVSVDSNSGQRPAPVVWWDLRSVVESAKSRPLKGTSQEVMDGLEVHLTQAVRDRLVSDVPLGAFLSGGIDSSLVVALMQKVSDRPVRTFSIGFEEGRYNEAVFARGVAEHLGTDHTEFTVTARQCRDVIPNLPLIFDEPFADSSQIPTYLVSQLARGDVTVSLSGDGGDEMFGGYERYFQLQETWERYRRIPGRGFLSRICRTAAKFFRAKWKERFLYRSRLLEMPDAARLYQHGNLHWQPDCGIVPGAEDCPTTYWQHEEWLQTGNCIEEWMWLDAVTYLPDDILVKVDRASMAVGLEVRVPLLDHRVVEYAWRLPFADKVDRRASRGKLPLRTLLARHVPRSLFERPKQGFGVPIDVWLRGPLRDWAEDLLDEARLRADGFLDPLSVRREWELHQSGRADRHYLLWDVLMFNAWLRAESH